MFKLVPCSSGPGFPLWGLSRSAPFSLVWGLEISAEDSTLSFWRNRLTPLNQALESP